MDTRILLQKLNEINGSPPVEFGSGCKTDCPACKASLRIQEQGDTITLRCDGGCTEFQIFQACGLEQDIGVVEAIAEPPRKAGEKSPIQVVLAALTAHSGREPTRNGEGWMATCPAHDDKKPSLSVKDSESGVMLHCFAGCKLDAIVAKLGIDETFLCPQITNVYQYHDEHGELLYEVVRYFLKSFRQRRPEGSGDYTWSVKGVRRVPYRLPEVINAVENDQRVFICEGEKDADALRALGLTATTNSAGAGKWQDEFARYFEGANVVILPDNDEPGVKHAAEVVNALSHTACEVRVVMLPSLPPSGDVSDWLASGQGREELEQIVATTDIWDGSFVNSVIKSEDPQASASGRFEDCVTNSGDLQISSPEASGRLVNSVTSLGPFENPTPFNAPTQGADFPTDALPQEIRDYVTEIAESRQVPVDLPAALAMGCVAAAVAGRIRVQVGETHDESTNLYVVSVMPPGCRKSAVFKDMTGPIRIEEAKRVEDAKLTISKAKEQAAYEDERLRTLRKTAATTDDTAQRQQALSEIEQLAANRTEIPAEPRLCVGDATPEKVASILAENQGRIAVFDAEGGNLFDILDGRYSRNPNLEVYLRGYSGDDLRVDRMGRASVFVKNPAITVALTVQPDVLIAMGKNEHFQNRGLLGRFLFSVPKNPIGSRTYADRPISPSSRNKYFATIKDLFAIPSPANDEDPEAVYTLHIRGEALRVWTEYANRIEQEQRDGGTFASMSDWASKAAGAVARIAGLIHTVKYRKEIATSNEIEAEVVRAACLIGEYFETHTLVAYDLIQAKPDVRQAVKLLAWITRHGLESFSLRDCHQHHRNAGKPEELMPGLDILSERNFIRRIPNKEKTAGRKKSPLFHFNTDNPASMPLR